MEDGPYANTRHHAIRRLAAQAQQAANSVVTPAALGGQPSRMAAVLQDQVWSGQVESMVPPVAPKGAVESFLTLSRTYLWRSALNYA